MLFRSVLKISVSDCETGSVKYLSDATECGEVTRCDSALSVYIPASGDGLWDTAKKLLQSPDEIQATNPDLTFPLTGKERILVYRPKQA